MDEKKQTEANPPSDSLHILLRRWKDGTFREIIDDWKWIFTYSAKYKGAIMYFPATVLTSPREVLKIPSRI